MLKMEVERMTSSLIKVGMVTTAILLGSGVTHNVQAETNQPDQYEVKVYADSHKIVKDNRHIKHSVLEDLGSEDKDEDFQVQYLDDANRTIIKTTSLIVYANLKMIVNINCSIKRDMLFLIMMCLVPFNKQKQMAIMEMVRSRIW